MDAITHFNRLADINLLPIQTEPNPNANTNLNTDPNANPQG